MLLIGKNIYIRSISMYKVLLLSFAILHVTKSYPSGANKGELETTSKGPNVQAVKLEPKRVWLEVPGEKSEKDDDTSEPTPEESKSNPSSTTSKSTVVESAENDNLDDNSNPSEKTSSDTSGHSSTLVVLTETGTKEDENYVACQSIRCTAPPSGHDCSEGGPNILLGLPEKLCCPVHTCRREDGSVFYHYAVELDEKQTISPETSVILTPASSNSKPPQQNAFQAPAQSQVPNLFTPLYPNINIPQTQAPAPAQLSNSYYNFNAGTAHLSSQLQATPNQGYYQPQPQPPQNPGSFSHQQLTYNNRFASARSVQNGPYQHQGQQQFSSFNPIPGLVGQQQQSVDFGNSLYRRPRNDVAPAFPNPNFVGNQWGFRARRNIGFIGSFGGY